MRGLIKREDVQIFLRPNYEIKLVINDRKQNTFLYSEMFSIVMLLMSAGSFYRHICYSLSAEVV